MKAEQFLHDGIRWIHVKIEWNDEKRDFPVIYIDDRKLRSLEDIKEERERSHNDSMMQTVMMMQMLNTLKGTSQDSKDDNSKIISKMIEALQDMLKGKKEESPSDEKS